MKEKTKSLLITIGVILAALLIVGLVVYNSLYDSGAILRGSTAVKSDHFSVNASTPPSP